MECRSCIHTGSEAGSGLPTGSCCEEPELEKQKASPYWFKIVNNKITTITCSSTGAVGEGSSSSALW